MAYSNILVEKRERAGLITLNRPQVLNALNHLTLTELANALRVFDNDPSVGAMVITGSERAFAAGADIKEMAEASMVDMIGRGFAELFNCFLSISKPVIAAVNGYALGGGCEIAMSCDMIVASETARFGQPEISIGVMPGGGGTQRLTRAVGKAVAMEMILNNRTLTAAEALQFGLVNRIVPVERCMDEALALANQIASRAPLAVRFAKEAVNSAFETGLTEGILREQRSFYLLFATEDRSEGMRAFVEKREPGWQGK
jgi:enoyl-CoA hydratase